MEYISTAGGLVWLLCDGLRRGGGGQADGCAPEGTPGPGPGAPLGSPAAAALDSWCPHPPPSSRSPGPSRAQDTAQPGTQRCRWATVVSAKRTAGVWSRGWGSSRGEWGVGWASIWPWRRVPPPGLGSTGRVTSETATKNYKYLIGYKLATMC